MQLLFSESEEHGTHEGLKSLPARSCDSKGNIRFRIWAGIDWFSNERARLLKGLDEGYVYFVHSYHVNVQQRSDLLATTDYYQPVTAIVGRDNVYGMQFHPEKSGELGMRLLGRFLSLRIA